MIEEGDPDRDLAALRVPQTGRLVATGNRYEPYQVVGLTQLAARNFRQVDINASNETAGPGGNWRSRA